MYFQYREYTIIYDLHSPLKDLRAYKKMFMQMLNNMRIKVRNYMHLIFNFGKDYVCETQTDSRIIQQDRCHV